MRSLFITLALSLIFSVATASSKNIIEKNGVKYTIHKIEKGETVYSLAKQYGLTIDELMAANEKLTDNVKVGQRIKIPMKDTPAEEPKREDVTTQSQAAAEGEVAPGQSPDSTTTLVGKVIAMLEQFTSLPESTVEAEVPFRTLKRGECANVVLMLPFGAVDKPMERYVDFYRGFLMGLDSVRLSGHSVKLQVYNTARDSVRVAEIVASGELEKADLVFGPIYEEELKPVLAQLEGKGIPVVSPLSSHSELKSKVLFQMAPAQEARMNKVRHLFDGSRKVLIISTEKNDEKLDAAVRSLLKDTTNVVEKRCLSGAVNTRFMGVTTSELLSILRGEETPPVVVVTSNNEYEVDRILNALLSVKQTLAYRSHSSEPLTIIGSASWARFKHMEKVVLFKNGVKLMTNYYANRGDRTVRTFERRFIRAYGSMPSLFAYRGYDAAILFIRSLYDGSIENNLEGKRVMPLSTPYLFEKNEDTGVRANSEWIIQRYNKDNTITFE